MLILFDHSTPAPLKHALKGHVVVEAVERGWEQLVNGDMLDAAEAGGFDLFVTADKNIRYQQNLATRIRSLAPLYSAITIANKPGVGLSNSISQAGRFPLDLPAIIPPDSRLLI